MLSDQNKIGLKYEPGCFTLLVDMLVNEHPVVW